MKKTLISLAAGTTMLATAASAQNTTDIIDRMYGGCAFQVSGSVFAETMDAKFDTVFMGPMTDDKGAMVAKHLFMVVAKRKDGRRVLVAMHNLDTDIVCGITGLDDYLGAYDELRNGTSKESAAPAPRKPNERDI